MKLTFIMIMGFTLASFAEGRAQTERINFKIDRIPAEMVIQQLKELTHYRFLTITKRSSNYRQNRLN